MADVMILPEFVQLLDDDIVSLTALTLMVNPQCRDDHHYTRVTQLTLSLYLMSVEATSVSDVTGSDTRLH